MNETDILILVVLGLVVIGAVYLAIRRRRRGSSCCGDCTGCGVCDAAKGKKK